MSFLYGLDFEQFRGLLLHHAGGGRRDGGHRFPVPGHHRAAAADAPSRSCYVITFGFSLFVPHSAGELHGGLPGAVDRLPHCHVHPAGAAGERSTSTRCALNYSKLPKKNPEYMAGSPIEAKEMHRMHRGEMARTALHRRTANAAGAQQGQAPMQQAPASQPVRQQAAAPQAPAQPAPQCPVSQAPARIPPVPKSAQAAPDPFDDDDYDGEGSLRNARLARTASPCTC